MRAYTQCHKEDGEPKGPIAMNQDNPSFDRGLLDYQYLPLLSLMPVYDWHLTHQEKD